MEYPDKEEHYLLRVLDKALADKIRSILRQPTPAPGTKTPSIELRFSTQEGADSEARSGELVVDGKAFPVKRQDLPTVVECFKTYDNINLVKAGDIGQAVIVPDRGAALPEGTEARNGVTPPLKDARRRRFRQSRDVNPSFMRQVEEAVLLISSGVAPDGYEFVDEEEEYIVAEGGASGSWQPYQPGRVTQASEAQKKGAAKRRAKKKGESEEPVGASQEGYQKQQKKKGDPSSQDDGMDVEDI